MEQFDVTSARETAEEEDDDDEVVGEGAPQSPSPHIPSPGCGLSLHFIVAGEATPRVSPPQLRIKRPPPSLPPSLRPRPLPLSVLMEISPPSPSPSPPDALSSAELQT